MSQAPSNEYTLEKDGCAFIKCHDGCGKDATHSVPDHEARWNRDYCQYHAKLARRRNARKGLNNEPLEMD